MNSTLALDGTAFLLNANRAPVFAASRPRATTRELSGTAEDVFKGITTIIDQLLGEMIRTRTSEEYKAAFARSFPKYVDVILALSRFADAVVPRDVLQRLQWESFCEMEADFRQSGVAAFGTDVQNQALFTVWTLRKINDLMGQIQQSKNIQSDEDHEYAHNYLIDTLCANFCLNCLGAALLEKQAIYPEVLEELIEGLRAAVNGYAWLRRGVELRFPEKEEVFEQVEWDDEDQALTDEASFDLLEDAG